MAFENYIGLNEKEVLTNRSRFGSNITEPEKHSNFLLVLKEIVIEPLFLILVCSSLIYFLMREYNEGIIMLVALCFVSGISLYQENKSRSAVSALNKLTSPRAQVIRNSRVMEIPSEEIVMGDLIVVADGNIVPADALMQEGHDFSVNESILTGEALPVFKEIKEPNNIIFQGTMIMTGTCVAKVVAIGKQTALGKIGQSLQEIVVTKTPLQQQIKSFVRSMVGMGAIAFIIVWGINYYLSKSLLEGLLHGLTLAMSVLPEEIPVAFSTFMALGAYHLYKKKVIARSPHTVETLGAATVICTDKTGTITENKMQLSGIYDFAENKVYDYTVDAFNFNPVLEHAMWSSEIDPFDPMEKSIHKVYSSVAEVDKRPNYSLIHEYPLSGNPPLMTHVFSDNKSNNINCLSALDMLSFIVL